MASLTINYQCMQSPDCFKELCDGPCMHTRITLSHYVIKHIESSYIVSHDFQDAGDALQSVCQSEVLAAF